MAGVNTAAMEALLEALLKQTQQQGAAQSRAFDRIARAAGLDPRVLDSTQAKLKKLGDEAEKTAEKSSAMNRAGEFAGSVLADLAQGAMATTGNLIQFGSKALQGSAKMSDLFAALKDLPLVGGFASFFAALARLQEETLDAYRTMSTAGVNFGDSLSQLRADALLVGLNLQEYAKYMKENSEAMILFGPNTSQGAKNLKEINKALVNGKLGEGLLNLGFSTQELNNLTVSYGKVVGGLTRRQQQDYAAVTAAAVKYGEELDFLARLTGKSRENQQKQLEEEMQEANWQAFLSTKDEATRQKLQLGVNESMALLGKGGAQIAKAQAMGIAVQGEQGRIATALFGEMATLIRNRTDQAMSGNISLNKFSGDSIRFLAGAQIKAAEGYERVIRPMGALALQNDALADSVAPMAKIYGDLRNNGVNTLEANVARLKQIEEEQKRTKATKDAELQAALAAEKAIREFSSLLAETMTPLLRDLLAPLVKEIAPKLPEMARAIKQTIDYFIPSILTPEGRQKIVNDLSELLTNLFKSIFAAMGETMFHQSGQLSTYQNFMNALNSVNPFAYMQRALDPRLDPFFKPPAAQPQPRSNVDQIPRTLGSWGATGKVIEDWGPNGTNITVHDKEGITTENQMAQIMSGSAAIGAQQAMEQISKGQAEIASLLRLVAENTRNTATATKDLNPNMFG